MRDLYKVRPPIQKPNYILLRAANDGDVASFNAQLAIEPDARKLLLAEGTNLLIESARDNSEEIVRAVLAAKPEIDLQDSNGFTALCWAAMRGRTVVVKDLLAAGADPNLGMPLIKIAHCDASQSEAICDALLSAGADINQVYHCDLYPPHTVLDRVRFTKRTALAAYLLARGAKSAKDVLKR